MLKSSLIATFVRAVIAYKDTSPPRHIEARDLCAAWAELNRHADFLSFSPHYEAQAAELELLLSLETDDLQRLYLNSALEWARTKFADAVIRALAEPETESRILAASAIVERAGDAERAA